MDPCLRRDDGGDVTKILHVSLAQLNPIVGDLPYNKKRILDAWGKVPENSDLIVFSELIVSGYPPEDLVLKPFFAKQVKTTVDQIVRASKDLRGAALIGTPWEVNGGIYNAVLLIENGKIIATCLKHHLPNYGVFDEARTFSAAPLPAPVEFRGLKLGIMICEDMWYPDVAAHLKKQGADIFVVPNASPFDADKGDLRMNYARKRVRETGLPLIYVNQTGGQDELVFDGLSFILRPDGEPILQGKEFDEGLYHETLTQNDQGQWFAVTKEIIPELEKPESIYQALLTGLRDYITKNGFPGVLIGLSGGIDSALSAIIAVDALGPEMVHGVMMPSRFTSQESLDDAAALAKALDIHLDTISIEKTVTGFGDLLKPHFTSETPAITFENIQPRTRGLILMALSNATGHMVLSTGNKSEIAVGYATLYGDMCGGFNVLKDIYKTQVYELANWRNTHRTPNGLGPRGAVIPARSITRAPTAELRADQTDQDTLPPYEDLDGILKCLIEEDLGLDEITARGHDPKIVAQVWKMLDSAEYKRRQAAPGIKITSRAFGRDRRYPITNHFVNIIEKKGA